MRILYIAPKLNHYKIKRIAALANVFEIDVVTGSKITDIKIGAINKIVCSSQECNKLRFNFKFWRLYIKSLNKYDFILMPYERKLLVLLMIIYFIKNLNARKTELCTFNHMLPKTKGRISSFFNIRIARFVYNKIYDKVVFYTENDCKKAVISKLIKKHKAFWANNTVDNTEIEKYYNFQLPPVEKLTILFIGRLIPSKRIKDVIGYYKALKPNFKQLRLEIIGDGPERAIVKEAIKRDATIKWHGTLVDEAIIAPIMKKASLVFIPGLSGLSINHAFAYGRPYITLKADKHGPEISYMDDSKNGYILDGNLEENTKIITCILQDRGKLIELCNNAKQKGEELSVKNWVQQMKTSLLDA